MQKIKIILALSSLFLISASAFSQSDAIFTREEYAAIADHVAAAHEKLNSLQADFLQERISAVFAEPVAQKGKMSFKSPDKLIWEYNDPQSIAIIFNKGTSSLKTAEGKVDSPNKMIDELGKIIISTVNGDNFTDNKNFKLEYRKGENGEIRAVLTPLNRKIKAVYKDITVIIDEKCFLAKTVIMTEVNGDSTRISFENLMINAEIPDAVFEE
ncbi:MAG: outer membrane lipoprotein carrier protein LolA [Bacteroidales bacterium]|nr:outer membrane lipoprotein carrier protein LolA [Bacteroidales bacterium]